MECGSERVDVRFELRGARLGGDSTGPQKLGQLNLPYSGHMYTIRATGLRALWQFVKMGRLPAGQARRRR